MIVVFAFKASAESTTPAASNTNNDDNDAKTEILRVDFLKKHTSTDGAEEERLTERPEHGKFVLGFVVTPLLVNHVTEEDDANKLGFVKFNQLASDWDGKGHEKANNQLGNLRLFGSTVVKAFAHPSNTESND